MNWLEKIEFRAKEIEGSDTATVGEAYLYLDYYEEDVLLMARVIRELVGVAVAAQDLIKSLREPKEPTNLRKSPVAAWLFAEDLRVKLDNLSPEAKEVIDECTAQSAT